MHLIAILCPTSPLLYLLSYNCEIGKIESIEVCKLIMKIKQTASTDTDTTYHDTSYIIPYHINLKYTIVAI